MLLYFKTSNNLSFDDEIHFTTVAGKYTDSNTKKEELPDNLIWLEKQKVNLVKASAIYGANASGKSNFLQTIFNGNFFVFNNFAESSSFLNWPFGKWYNKTHVNNVVRPIYYCYGLLFENIQFEYSFSIDAERVIEEKLLEYRTQKPIEHFYRKFDPKAGNYIWSFSKYFTGEKEAIKNITNERSLFLSVGAVSKLEICQRINNWFTRQFVYALDKYSPGNVDDTTTLRLMTQSEEVKKFVMEKINEADFSILDFIIEDESASSVYNQLKVTSLHRAIDKDNKASTFKLDYFESESTGTRRYIGWLDVWFDIISQNKTGLADEFGSSMHSLLSTNLIKNLYRWDNEISRPQLIFTTHDTNLMTRELLRPDQIWITERDELGNSSLYSLSDFKIKKGKDLEKGYLQGLYGGIPQLKD